MSTLDERIREFMMATSWDEARIAAVAGVSRSAVAQWLGKGSKIIKTIGNLEAALMLERESGFSALWLARGKGPKKVVVSAGSDEKPQAVREFTPLPDPFVQTRFAALLPEQQRDIAHVAAYLVDAFARYGTPPSGERGPWKRKQRLPIEAEASERPNSLREVKKQGRS